LLGVGVLWLAYNRAIYLIFLFFAIIAGGLLIPYLAMMSMLHPRRTHPQITPTGVGIARWENVRLIATDGVELSAWFIPPGPEGDGATLVFVHGLGGNRSELLAEAAMLARHGYGALLIDLRHHGDSQGKMATLGFAETEDVCGAVKFLLSRPEVNPARIGLLGHSMGGATVLRAAARMDQVRAVVAQSAYSSLEENVARGTVAQAGLPPFLFGPLIVWLGERASGLRLKQVRPIDDVPAISPRAILFVHGKQDHAISTENSLRLYAAANEPKELYLMENAGHKAMMAVNPAEYENRVVTFLDRHLRGDDPA
jgi:dipeptidyl aminopeptidase/acylaminoacyl peptidase